MIRILLGLALLLSITGSAAAERKAKIAVLGIEVVGTVDIETTRLALNLTESLRQHARSTVSLVIAPNSDKELIDEKLASSCETEAMACMVTIAKKLGANLMLFGRLEKRDRGYQVSLKLLDVERRTMTPWNDDLPGDEVDQLVPWSRTGFATITGEDPTAEAVVPARPPSPEPSSPWRTRAIVASIGTVAMAGAFGYTWNRLSQLGKQDGLFEYGSKCFKNAQGEFVASPEGVASPDDCGTGGTLRIATFATGAVLAGVGVFTLVAWYKSFKTPQERRENVAGTRKSSRFAVTPIVSPAAAGAILQLDF